MKKQAIALLLLSAIAPHVSASENGLPPAPPKPHGLIVHVGTIESTAAKSLIADQPVVLLAVAKNAAAENAMRADFAKAGLAGQVTVASLAGTRIPLIDNVATLVIASDTSVDQAELLRIARPLGKVQAGGKTIEKPRPETFGQWGQYHFDATMSDVGNDRAAGPAYGIQWLSGPQDSSAQGVRVVNDVFVQPEGRPQMIVARDASSGLPLWQRPDITSVSRYAFLLDDARVYLYPQVQNARFPAEAMIALDKRTGQTVTTYSEGITFKVTVDVPANDHKKREEVVKPLQARAADFQARLAGNSLLQVASADLVMLDADTGKRRWAATAANGQVFMFPVMTADRVFVLEGPKASSFSYTHWPAVEIRTVHCLDAATGQKVWSLDWPKDREATIAYNLTTSNGKLAAVTRVGANKGKVSVLIVDAKTGKEGFFGSNEVFKGEIGGGHSSARAIAIGDRLWFTTITVVGGSMSLTNPNDPAQLDRSFARVARPVGCTAYRATPNWLFGSLTTYSLDGKQLVHTDAARTSCDVGAFPANGLSYITSNHCFCQPYLPGSIAFHSRPFGGVEQLQRLERGTAAAAPARAEQANEWPMFLRDNMRTAWSPEKLQPQLKQLWSIKPGADTAPANPLLAKSWDDHWYAHGPLSQTSVAEGVAVAALTHRQQVLAFDPATGAEKWRTDVDGRVDSAPTIHKGLVLAGTHNGWLYALNRDSGQLVWRFHAAPRRERIVVDGQLESPWPLFGTVNVDDKGIYAMAGRHTDSDGGMFWYQLSLSGEVIKQGRVGEDALKSTTTGGGNPGRSRITGSNTPAVMTADRYLMAGVHLARSEKGLEPWFGLFPEGRSWEHEFWQLRHGMRSLVPGNQGLLARVDFLGGYKLAAYVGTQGRMYAYNGDDFVMIGGSPRLQHRGGDSDSELRRVKRVADFNTTTQPNPREPGKLLYTTKGAEEVWNFGEPLARGNGATALAVASDTVLQGIEVTNRDRHRERAAMAYRLQLINFADGTVRQDLALPAPPIVGGIAVAAGRVYVTTNDGSLTCFGAP